MIFRWLLALVPIALGLHYLDVGPPLLTFGAAILAIVPLAEWIRRATEHLSRMLGGAIGGLLNVTFGNMAELMLAVFVLLDGKPDVVKGQITGSIIGNGLLGLGVAVVAGSWGREHQTFNRASAGRLSSLLILAVIALLLPALFDYTERGATGAARAGMLDEHLSLGVAVVLVLIYAANLVYTLITHRDVFSSACEAGSGSSEGSGNSGNDRSERHDAAAVRTAQPDASHPSASDRNPDRDADSGKQHTKTEKGQQKNDGEGGGPWPWWVAAGVLLVGTALTAWMAELVSGGLESASSSLGVSTFFLGVIVLAVIGNAAEYVAAVYYARKDRMTMVMGITVGSTIQVALLVAPLLVLVSYAVGSPMNLVFSNPLELIAIAGVAFTVNAIAQDGETTWFEGVLLIGVYVLLALAFFFVTPPGGG